MRITLVYSVPVFVVVETDEVAEGGQRVCRVHVLDEALNPWYPKDATYEDGSTANPAAKDLARKIAIESQDWPGLEFGV